MIYRGRHPPPPTGRLPDNLLFVVDSETMESIDRALRRLLDLP
ncbi:hypothetical protein [Nocardia inohanensis]|nr:hypothetical protein [Nocardia inohanensis]